MLKRFIIASSFLIAFGCQEMSGRNVPAYVDYLPADSAEICAWLEEARSAESRGKGAKSIITFFGQKMLGRPYVAHTLEHNKKERLVVNTRELDCTTFTETVMALALCHKNGKATFNDYCEYLKNLRYRCDIPKNDPEPRIAYSHRNHYFTGWGISNVKQGYFTEITAPASMFSATQQVYVDYMTKHPEYYKMRNETPTTADSLTAEEKRLSAKGKNLYKYIPKNSLKNTNTKAFREAIHEGDIVVILTNKPGLDTQHITMAHWDEKDGQLHIMHASSLRKKVVFEPLTLYEYLQRQKSATGIRIFRLKP